MNTENNIELARHLVDLFYPLVELTRFDAKGAIQEIQNAFSTLKEDQEFNANNMQTGTPLPELLVVGRNVRCLTYPIRQGKKIVGYLRLRYDLTHFKNLQEQLNFLVQSGNGHSSPETTGSWKESIDQIITHHLVENKINISATNAKQKRELISRLQEKGLLDFKESSAYIASKLGVSRATVYNYLKTSAYFKKIRVHQVDAFTNKRFGGNPAGVVLDADELDESTMRNIARELNLSKQPLFCRAKKVLFKCAILHQPATRLLFAVILLWAPFI